MGIGLSNAEGKYCKLSCLRYLGVESCQEAFEEGMRCGNDWSNFDFKPILWYYRTNGIFKRIIDIIPDNALKNGITINGDNQMLLEKMLDDFDYKKYFSTALKQARLFGRSLMVLSIDDGQYLQDEEGNYILGDSGRKIIDVSKKVDFKQIKDVKINFVYGADDFSIYYGEENDQENNGQKKANSIMLNWEYYTLNRVRNNRQINDDAKDNDNTKFKIHKSRALLFVNDDIFTDATAITKFATSEFFRVFQPLSRLELVEESATADAANSQIGVLKMNLELMLENAKNDDERRNLIRTTLNKLELVRVAREQKEIVAIDKDEEYKNIPASLNGFGDIIEKLRKGVSSASDIPMSILFGEKQSGLSNDGSKDLEVFYNIVKSKQETALRQPLLYLIKLMDYVIKNNHYSIKKVGSNKNNFVVVRQEDKKPNGLLGRIKSFFSKEKTNQQEQKENEEDEEEAEERFYNVFYPITFEFNELWQLSSVDKAKIRKMDMETFRIAHPSLMDNFLSVEEIRSQSELNTYFQYNDNNTRNIAPKPTKTYPYNQQQNIDNSNKNNTSSSD